jgi:hypothetical protein
MTLTRLVANLSLLQQALAKNVAFQVVTRPRQRARRLSSVIVGQTHSRVTGKKALRVVERTRADGCLKGFFSQTVPCLALSERGPSQEMAELTKD